MKLTRESEIDPAPLEGKRVAILGYGNQGRAQSLNLKDSGIDLIVGLREGSPSRGEAEAAGLQVQPLAEAGSGADVVMLLAPDEILGDLYAQIEPQLRPGVALGFSHGLAVHFALIEPREDLDVFLVAPKGPGTALRSLFQAGKGMVALWAVAQNRSGSARDIALAYGRAIGCARAGLIKSSFEEEAVADLFNENAVVWGGVPELLRAGFETLVEAGISPEVAYLECVGELKLLSELIEARGLAGMREVISNTAELGAVLGGPQVIDRDARERMLTVLESVKSGEFAQQLRDEARAGYPLLRAARASARSASIEDAFEKLQRLERGA
ncbi:MAG: ketol-acid reductoisomerase [Pseudomonadota bacterium]|nr:ketol-acid reductoisomerase [Sphingomonas sp.]MDQ3479589.1 ketol-acid reductoisomerase [Pseudomonadota bacterium]